ncbi:MAG: flippase-like domain-containing protein [Candidatus Brocadiaceae bacterium]|nr:flippase-like domain-containing protein [Candidatus Brocadiaceae bacterium]
MIKFVPSRKTKTNESKKKYLKWKFLYNQAIMSTQIIIKQIILLEYTRQGKLVKNRRRLKLLFLFIGCAILFALIYKVGPLSIYHQLSLLRWKILFLLLPYMLVFILDTLGWKYAFRNSKICFKDLFVIRLAGESVNLIVPSATFAGEPVKAYFLKKHNVPMVDGMASVVISRAIMTISQIIFVMIGVVLLLYKLNVSGSRLTSSIAIILLGIPIIVFIVFIQKHGLFTFLLKLLRMFRIKIRYIEDKEDKLRELDKNIYQFYRHNKKKAFSSFIYYFLGWLAGLIEVFLILYFLNIPIDTITTYIIESLSTVAKGVTSFIPGSVGGQEGGIIAIFASLKLGSSIALTFGILRRFRELIWTGIGLFILSKLEWSIADQPTDK